MIDQIFAHQWFIAVGAARSNLVAEAFAIVGSALMDMKAGIIDGATAARTHKMLRVPGRSQCVQIVAPDRLSTSLTDQLL